LGHNLTTVRQNSIGRVLHTALLGYCLSAVLCSSNDDKYQRAIQNLYHFGQLGVLLPITVY